MYEENRNEYTVRTCSTEDPQGLEDLLNDMAEAGWELYSLNESEDEDGEYQYLCIFCRQAFGHLDREGSYIVEGGDFSTTMKRLLIKNDDIYKECRYLQQQIKEKQQQIKEVKDSLDICENVERESLNKKISEKMGEVNSLKNKLSELLSPSGMYNRISQDILTITVSYELAELIDNEKDGDLIAESAKLRQKITDKLGYVIPRIHFAISDEINENEYIIKIRSFNALTGLVYPGHRRFFVGQSNLENMPDDAIKDVDPISEQEVFWLDETQTKDFWDNGLTPSQVITAHLEYIARKHVDEILSYKDILSYISLLDEGNAFLVEDLFQKDISIGDLRYIFANLINENISVKDVVYIFEKLNDISDQEDNNNDQLIEDLRIALKRQICNSIADSNNTICAITLPKKHKKNLGEALKTKNNSDLDDIVDYVTDIHKNTQTNVLIVDPKYRKDLFNLFINIIPDLTVISENEVADEFTVEEC